MDTFPEASAASPAPTQSPTASRQQYLVLLLLLLALPLVYFSQLRSLLWGDPPAADAALMTYVADLDFWQRTERETIVTATANFDLAHDLHDVPLTVGKWQGEDVPETNEEVMILLDPEQYIQRLYQRESGEYLWLSMIGGRSSRPFHAPDICYDADGWQYNLGSHPIALADGSQIYGLWLEADKAVEGQDAPLEHIVFYFYLFPSSARQLADGIVLFKLTSGRYGTVEETLAIHADFIRELFPGTVVTGEEVARHD